MTFDEDVWWWRDRFYVPESLRKKVMHLFHAPATAGHWGVAKTLDLLTRSFNWPNARADLLNFIASCTSCQQVKIDRRPPQGKLMSLPIPDRPWSMIGVDFIVKLPISFGYDSIMVVVDHLTKAVHFIPALESWKADDLARAFVTDIFRLHGLPDVIVSDRGTTFMSRFWTSVLQQLQISPAPSTAFHPATDGQTEKTNGVLEDYLRHFVAFDQKDWKNWLSLAEFSYNNSPSASTGFSPFFSLQGYHPRFNSLAKSSVIPSADQFVKHLQQIQENLSNNLSLAKESQERFYNGTRRMDVIYSPGDLVWLSRRHLKTKRPSNKLDVRRIGPFTVKRMIGRNAAELILPANLSRLHPVFNVSLLMPYVENLSPLTDTPPLDPQAFFDDFVDWGATTYILNYRTDGHGMHEYLVRGLDASGLDDGWQNISTIPHSLDPFLRQFHRQSPMLGPGPRQATWRARSTIEVSPIQL